VPLDFQMLPALLKAQHGYETHAVGKWNLGNLVKAHTPTFRGFDSFVVGYYAAALKDYWYHGGGTCKPSAGVPEASFLTDLSNSSGANVSDGVRPCDAPDVNGTYDLDVFAADAVRRIETHAAEQRARREAGQAERGLYIYAAFQNVHSAVQDKSTPSGSHPLHSPCNEVDTHYASTTNDTYKVMGAMLTWLDFGFGNLTEALDKAGRTTSESRTRTLLASRASPADQRLTSHLAAGPYVIALSADNGGPLPHSTNAPLRGGKHSLWEGTLAATRTHMAHGTHPHPHHVLSGDPPRGGRRRARALVRQRAARPARRAWHRVAGPGALQRLVPDVHRGRGGWQHAAVAERHRRQRAACARRLQLVACALLKRRVAAHRGHPPGVECVHGRRRPAGRDRPAHDPSGQAQAHARCARPPAPSPPQSHTHAHLTSLRQAARDTPRTSSSRGPRPRRRRLPSA
jgi:hypothetical protein